ncbi:MAG TPA: hypothetical protein VGK67_16915 [Myxococcales bacterium]|jgi:hypothetical protein
MDLKTLTPNLKRDPGLPSGVWDPMWERPEVAHRVAVDAYLALRVGDDALWGGDGLLAAEALPDYPKKNTEERTFALGEVRTFEESPTRFRGGSYGEIFRRYTYGQTKPSVNFHAQAATFGLDSEGRYFLKGVVGRVDGIWGNKAALCCRFLAGAELVGGVFFEAELDPPQDVPFRLTGVSPRLRERFDAITAAQVLFFSKST